MKQFVIFLFFIFINQNVFSQQDFRKGYVVTLNGDTLNGLIDYRQGNGNFNSCKFKFSEADKLIGYTADDIDAYGFENDKLIVSKDVSSVVSSMRRIFLEVLVEGKVTLYKYKSYFFIEKNGVISKLFSDVEPEIEIGNSSHLNKYRYNGILTALLSDCFEVRADAEQCEIAEKSLTQLLVKYYEYLGDPYRTYKSNKSWFEFRPGILLGGIYSKLSFSPMIDGNEYLTYGFEPSRSFLAGFTFELLSPKLNEKVSFIGDIAYASSEFNSFYNIDNTKNEITVEWRSINIPLGIRYTFFSNNNSPYLDLGISGSIHSQKYSYYFSEVNVDNVITSYKRKVGTVEDFQLGYWFGIGGKKTVSKRTRALAEFRYEHLNGFKESQMVSEINNFQLIVGLSFVL